MAQASETAKEAGSLRLRRRVDLEIYPQRRRSQKVWVIKDPVSLRYFQFREEEFAILSWLDGRASLEQIKQRFERRFAPRRMTHSRLHSFIGNLHRSGLVLSDAPGQGKPLQERHDQQRRSTWLNSFANPLAIRFRGVDPERFLTWLYPKVRWVFSPWCCLIAVTMILTAATLFMAEFDEFERRLPEMNSLMNPRNLLMLAVIMALVKLIHELGHALVLKHYGGRCHELGVMLLVFTPCLYCNVTDAWKLSNRWQRIAISSAGIMIEVVLASACTLLWMYSQPGLLNTLCLNVMVVCSVGTVLLNGNPLLRYDGYYILSDLLELPNLWQDSRNRLHRLVSRAFIGIDPGTPVSQQGRPGILLIYAIASVAYRILVMVSILYLVYRVCKPEGLLLIAQILSAVLMIGIFSTPLTAVSRIMTNPVLRRKVSPRRMLLSGGATILALAGFFLIPLPCRIVAPAMIEPHDARRVYVSVPGTLKHSVLKGQSVRLGDPLATLENIEIRRELESVQGQVLQQQLRVRNLESMRVQDGAIAAQLPAAKEILSDLRRRLSQLQRDETELVLTAPVAGTVLPPPSVQSPGSNALQLSGWSGTPMDECNLGMTLDRKTLYCLIGQPDEFEVAVYIDQSDVRYVRENQRVRMLLDIAGGKIVNGTVTEVSQVNLQRVPAELAVDQQISHRIDDSGMRRPENTSYKTHVRLDTTDVPLLIGARGRAKILVQWQPLSQQVYRFLSRTFKTVI